MVMGQIHDWDTCPKRTVLKIAPDFAKVSNQETDGNNFYHCQPEEGINLQLILPYLFCSPLTNPVSQAGQLPERVINLISFLTCYSEFYFLCKLMLVPCVSIDNFFTMHYP